MQPRRAYGCAARLAATVTPPVASVLPAPPSAPSAPTAQPAPHATTASQHRAAPRAGWYFMFQLVAAPLLDGRRAHRHGHERRTACGVPRRARARLLQRRAVPACRSTSSPAGRTSSLVIASRHCGVQVRTADGAAVVGAGAAEHTLLALLARGGAHFPDVPRDRHGTVPCLFTLWATRRCSPPCRARGHRAPRRWMRCCCYCCFCCCMAAWMRQRWRRRRRAIHRQAQQQQRGERVVAPDAAPARSPPRSACCASVAPLSPPPPTRAWNSRPASAPLAAAVAARRRCSWSVGIATAHCCQRWCAARGGCSSATTAAVLCGRTASAGTCRSCLTCATSSKRTLAAAARLVRRILHGALACAVVAAASNAAPRRWSRRIGATHACAAKGSRAASAQGCMDPARA